MWMNAIYDPEEELGEIVPYLRFGQHPLAKLLHRGSRLACFHDHITPQNCVLGSVRSQSCCFADPD